MRIAGPYELNKWDGSKRPLHPEDDFPLIQGYNALNYSLGILAPGESWAKKFLETNHPDTWFSLSAYPKAYHVFMHSGKITVVTFPVNGGKAPTHKMIQEVLGTLKKIRTDKKTKLIVGMSPWGRKYEQKFVDDHPGVCDILLGSGPGPGLTSFLSADKRTLWIRPYSKGRTISMIQIEDFPTGNTKSTWRIGQTINARLLILNGKILNDPAMQKILTHQDTLINTTTSRRRKTPCNK